MAPQIRWRQPWPSCAAKNQLIVLCQGTGTLDLVDLGAYTVTDRINATNGSTSGTWPLPAVTSITPNTAKIGSIFGMGGGMAAGDDPTIKVTNISVNSAGAQVTASVQILSAATAGTRQIRLGTKQGDVMGAMNSMLFTVAQ